MSTIKVLLFLGIAGVYAYAGGGGPVALPSLITNADVITFAAVKDVVEQPDGEQITLQIWQVLQGQPDSLEVTAHLRRSAGYRSPTGALYGDLGARGIWFLKSGSGGYQALPVFENPVWPREVFLTASPEQLASAMAVGTLNQQLFNLSIAAYRGLVNPGGRDDFQLLSTIFNSDPKDGMAAAGQLAASASLQDHIMGLSAEIHLGSPAALSQVADELDTLKSDRRFGHVLSAIEGFPAAPNSDAVSAFEKLIALHSDVAGFDGTVSTGFVALANATTAANSPLSMRAVLPGMIGLLDSKDTQTQLRAAQFLGFFTLFADANGDFPHTGVAGPFNTEGTRQFTPQNGSSLTAADYAGFWKVWWAQNRAKFSF